MQVQLLIQIALSSLCLAYNISWSLATSSETRSSSAEKITTLIKEEAKTGKKTGYNVANIKLSNEVILKLLDKGTKKEHGDEILRLISEYTVGMNEITLDIVLKNDFKNMWTVYNEILMFGKPSFIEHKFNLQSVKARFGWNEGPADYFSYIRRDALKAWNYFVKEYTALKEKL